LEKSTYEKVNPKPIPRFNPIPPLIFREERDKPMIVNTKNDIMVA